MTLVIVCGLKAEAKIARGGDDLQVIIGGGDQGRLAADLAGAAPYASGLLSFGLAGGLAPGLRPGDIRVADVVMGPDGTSYHADAGWSLVLADKLSAPTASFAGSDAPLADVAGKAALHLATGAAMVDMETHLVAASALAAGVPFAAVRVVTDAAERPLPHAASVGMRADGKVDLAAILASLARNPAQLPGLIRTGLDARVAFASLFRCRQLLGPGFALLDLREPLIDMT